MKKIISLFQRNYDGDHLVRDEVTPGAEWVIAGEGMATRKWDGTCCMIKDGILYKRYDSKHGKKPPEGFIPAQDPDEKTGHWPGWLKVGDGPEDEWHRQGIMNSFSLLPKPNNSDMVNGTYELCGPKVNGNNEGLANHALIKHGDGLVNCFEVFQKARDFESIKRILSEYKIEGIVWHHPDGRMVKIKAKDFGIKRGGCQEQPSEAPSLASWNGNK